MSPPRPASLHELIVDLRKRLQPKCIVAIDGGGGAGKSTLADTIASVIYNTAIVRMDDFYRVLDPNKRAALSPDDGSRLYIHWERVQQDVLEPLANGRRARYQRYDWCTNMLAEWITVEPVGLILIEGVTSMRKVHRKHLDLKIYIETSTETRLNRIRNRAENPEAWIRRWDAAERVYQREHTPQTAADYIIVGE